MIFTLFSIKMNATKTLLCKSNVLDLKNFWRTIAIFVKKPHVINRKLAGSEIVIAFKCSASSEATRNLFEVLISSENAKEYEFVARTLDELQFECELFDPKDLSDILESEQAKSPESSIIVVNKLLPKSTKIHCIGYELIVFGKTF